jgi:hypothetical protein
MATYAAGMTKTIEPMKPTTHIRNPAMTTNRRAHRWTLARRITDLLRIAS